jgi:hypothetical protein
VATYSSGVTVNFGGNLAEVTGLSVNWGGGFSVGRSVTWRPQVGQVSVELLGSVLTSNYGTRGTLTITGGGVGLTCTAVCTDVGAVTELNGLTRYTYTFDILDN